jgi:hypothetical protein
VLFDGNADALQVTIPAADGDNIVCDWFDLNATGATPTAQSVTQLPTTGVAPAGDSNDASRWGALGLLSGAAAYAAARLRKSAIVQNECGTENES